MQVSLWAARAQASLGTREIYISPLKNIHLMKWISYSFQKFEYISSMYYYAVLLSQLDKTTIIYP